MKTETPMDHLMYRVARFNALADMTQEDISGDGQAGDSQQAKKKKKGGKSGGFFSAVVGEIFFRRDSSQRASIVGITHPSDGHPQEELTPDFGWFRALGYNNPTWTLYWPELII